MGSRIMHFTMATLINRDRDIGNDFLIGSIAPDLNKNSKTPKELTHYMKKRSDGEHDMFPEKFIEEYGNKLTTFQLGYYLHLLSDDLWLRTIYNDCILENEKLSKKEALGLLYEDFHLLNQLLINDFGLEKISINLNVNSFVDEIRDEDIPLIIRDLNEDFEGNKLDFNLKLLNYESILNYIKQSVELFDKKVIEKSISLTNLV